MSLPAIVIPSFTNCPLVIVVAEICPAIVSAVIEPPNCTDVPAIVIASFDSCAVILIQCHGTVSFL